ncbi:MAG TPA: ABC transporter permease, partial [Pyrinomonadaceae bacterium]|nr:ABC transporter permease [Pyrinomonadaceae bacterium]
MGNLLRDLRYGVRLLFKNPGFTTVAALSLALGIGVNAPIFSLVDAFLLRTLPVENAERLVYVLEGTLEEPYQTTSYLNYIDMREGNDVFASLAAYSQQPIFLTTGARTEQVSSEVVTGNYFSVLAVSPAAGRAIVPSDDQTANPQMVAVVSNQFWRSRLGGEPSAVGRQITLNNQSFTVVGVAPASFKGTTAGAATDVWVPVTAWAMVIRSAEAGQANKTAAAGAQKDAEEEEKGGETRLNRGHAWLSVIGRTKPGVTNERAQSVMTTIANRLQQSYGETRDEKKVTLVPVTELHPRARTESVPIASLALAGAFVVLLIACVNVASLLLSRATVRRREIAIRLALGSSRRRLVQQLLTESVLLALLGGCVGLLLSMWASDLLLAFIPAQYARFVPDFGVSGWVVAFTFVVSLVTGVIFGLAPALNASKTDLIHVMKDNAASSGGGGGRLKLRNLLVVFQIAISLVLLVAAGLFVRSLWNGRAVGDTFKSDRVLLLSLAPRDFGYNTTIDKDYARQLVERVAQVPGVQAATLANSLPFDMATSGMPLYVEGRDTKYEINQRLVAPRYFETFNLPILRGRDFTDRDDPAAPKVAIISDSMARQFWPNQNPIGQRLRTAFPQNPLVEVVGVAQDSKDSTRNEGALPDLYLPVYQKFESELNLVVRTAGPPAAMVEPIKREVEALGKRLPIYDFKMLDEVASLQLLPLQVAAAISGFFGLLGLLVATVGIYGITAYSFSQRTREIGIRMA